jgi:ribosomal protein S27AE
MTSPGTTKEARRAHAIVTNAITYGRLERPTECEKCGPPKWSNTIIVAHHDDYTKPLDVRWLCGSCHRRHHLAKTKPASKRRKVSA